jgi:hypothetical protein
VIAGTLLAAALFITEPVRIIGNRLGTDIDLDQPGIAASRNQTLLVWRNGAAAMLDREGRRTLTMNIGGPTVSADYEAPPDVASDGDGFLVVYPTADPTGTALEAKMVDARGGVREIGIVSDRFQHIQAHRLLWTGAGFLEVFSTPSSVRLLAISADGTVRSDVIANQGAYDVGAACDPLSCRVTYNSGGQVDVLRADLRGRLLGSDGSITGSYADITWDGSRYLLAINRGDRTVVASIEPAAVFDIAMFGPGAGGPFPRIASDGLGDVTVLWRNQPARFPFTVTHVVRVSAGSPPAQVDQYSSPSYWMQRIVWDGGRFLVTDAGVLRAYERNGSKTLVRATPRPPKPPCRTDASGATIGRTTLVSFTECWSWNADGLNYEPSTRRFTLITPGQPDREVTIDTPAGFTAASTQTFLVGGVASNDEVIASRFSQDGQPLDGQPLKLGFRTFVEKPKAIWNGRLFVVVFNGLQFLIPEAGPARSQSLGGAMMALGTNGTSHLLLSLLGNRASAALFSQDGDLRARVDVGPAVSRGTVASNGDEYVVFLADGSKIAASRIDRDGALLDQRQVLEVNNSEIAAIWDGFHYLFVWSDSVQVAVQMFDRNLERVGDVQRFVDYTFRSDLRLSLDAPGVTRLLTRCDTICSQLAIEGATRNRAVSH